jgi:ATP-dependent Lon protease
MDSMKYYMQHEDEMDFMPIIPLNEGDGDGLDDIVIPPEITLLPLRNTVLFPGVVIPITVGRDKSIKAIAESYKTDKLVGVLSQKDSNVEDPSISDLVSVGTVAKIIKLIKMPDGGTTAILQGKKRFFLKKITAEEPYFKGEIEALDDEIVLDDKSFDASIASIKDLAGQIIQLSPNIPTEASIILRNIENPAFLIHFVGSNLNCELTEKQQLLEMNDMRGRAEMLLKLLQNELQFVELKNKVTTKTKTELDKQQREYFLQQQLKSIKEELGGDSNTRPCHRGAPRTSLPG